MARRPAFVAALAAALIAASAATASAEGGDRGLGIRISAAPEARADDPRARVAIVDSGVAGGTAGPWRIELENDTDRELPVQIFATAASVDGGAFSIPSEPSRGGLADWIRLDESRVILGPGERREIEVTIVIPPGAEPGERFGAVVVEPPAVDGGSLTLVNRVATRVYFAVEGATPLLSDFEIMKMEARTDPKGTRVVSVEVANTGSRTLEVSGELALGHGPAGLAAGPFPASDPSLVVPGSRGTVDFALDSQLPSGPWRAEVHLRSGLVERSAEATITFPEAAGEVAAPVAASPIDQQRRVLLPLAVTLFLVVLLAVLFVLFARRRRKDEDGTSPPGGHLQHTERHPDPVS